ncbi:MAG TPA: L,D-transpeptidase family protein [Hyphomicrobium sp.]|nr:L,D-transpeptidase family protein [Hyphomicrobium sp.]
MGSRDRYSLMAIGVAAALASAALVRALDDHGYLEHHAYLGSTAMHEPTPEQAVSVIVKTDAAVIGASLRDTTSEIASTALQAADRFDYVARKELLWPGIGEDENNSPEQQALLEEALREEASESENPDFWTAQTSAAPSPASIGAAQPPQVARLAPTPDDEQLPWEESSASGGQKRNLTLTQRLGEISPAVKQRLAEKFENAKAAWPPADVALVAVKDEKTLELFSRAGSGDWTFVHRYKVLAASGGPGPKLKRGDKQVPEGVYGISFLNPNSRYHVSMRVSYPNAFDRQMAANDGRKDLGGDIMIHGKNVSIGCLAIGDEAAEELFVLASVVGLPKIKVIIAPTDLRDHQVAEQEPGGPAWLPKLYAEIKIAMAPFKAPAKSSGLLSFFEN